MTSIVPVILSGGGGTRLWPYSTSETPKQFLPLLSDGKTLFRNALDRVEDRAKFRAPLVVASMRHRSTCEQELATNDPSARLILEPVGRNTAAAVVMAAMIATEHHRSDALLLVMPSDHVIERLDAFHAAIFQGVEAAERDLLVTFGVRPLAPETGYGYLKMGDPLEGCPSVRNVAQFVEKPIAEVARSMVASGDYLWNAGIFLFKACAILREAQRTAPDIVSSVGEALARAERQGQCILPDPSAFERCRADSIDCAVMEHSSSVAVVPMSPGWSDLGSWDALVSILGTDQAVGPITALDCESCYIRSDGVQVAALGIRDLIVVASGERLLILPRGRSQEVKMLLSAMDSIAA